MSKGLRSRPKPSLTAAPRAWQRMLSGRRLDLLDPSPLDVEIEDIAHGLARVARWNGQTVGEHAFSVAQHSLVVEDIAARLRPGLEARWRLAALLHDAPEYVIGDMISPFKTALGVDYKRFEARLEAAVHLRFGLPVEVPEEVRVLIKAADRVCAGLEAVQLAGFKPDEALRLFGPVPDSLQLEIRAMAAGEAQAAYLGRFHLLMSSQGLERSPEAFSTE